jgi:hypothetical protein
VQISELFFWKTKSCAKNVNIGSSEQSILKVSKKKEKKDDGLIKVAHCPPIFIFFELHQNLIKSINLNHNRYSSSCKILSKKYW